MAFNVALLLAAAKAHGRQMRMERLAQGHAIAGFQRGVNPPWVEARWAWERRWFWGLYPVMLIALSAGIGLTGWAPLWAFILDLSLMGAVAWARLERDMRARRPAVEALLGGAWIARVRLESALWWVLVLGLAVLVVWLPAP
jgi:hypothetical protein